MSSVFYIRWQKNYKGKIFTTKATKGPEGFFGVRIWTGCKMQDAGLEAAGV
jgi:hypothetical protein